MIKSDEELERLRADYWAAKTAFLAATAALTAHFTNRKALAGEVVRELEAAKLMLNAAGKELSAAERAAAENSH